MALLGDILDGYMLSQWKARAQDVKQHGWYWEYTLVGARETDATPLTLRGWERAPLLCGCGCGCA